MNEKWINSKALADLLSPEPYLLLGALILVTWGFYKFFLNDLLEERHKSLQRYYGNLLRHFVVLTLLLGAYLFLLHSFEANDGIQRITPYIALLTYVWGAVVFIKTCRTLILQYMFMGSMRLGVPIIIVNIFTILLSILLAFWSISQIFGVQLGPLLATSAAFSIILGLALQDTLGNLFAGVSLQIDRCYEIGDWIEVTVSGTQKIIGQVKEITWRSTILTGLSDEIVTLPNRLMAQAQLSNFSPPDQPIVRTQTFKLPYGSSPDTAIHALEKCASEIFEIRGIPAPFAYVADLNEHWIQIKLVYFIDSFGAQHTIGDKILRKGLEALEKNHIHMAQQRLEVDWHESRDRKSPKTNPSEIS